MAAVLPTLLACAALDSLNPSVLAITIYLLLTGGGDRPTAARVLTYVGTVATAYFAIGALILLGLGAAGDQLRAGATHPAGAVTIAVAGAALLAWSLVDSHLDKKDPMRKERRKSRLPAARDVNPASLVALGTAVTVLEFATAAPYLAAIGTLTAHAVPAVLGLPLLAGYVAVMSLPPLALLLGYCAVGDRLDDRLQRWQRKIVAGSRATLQWIVGIVGVMLARYGLGMLAEYFGN